MDTERLPSEYLGDSVYAVLDVSRSLVLRTAHHEEGHCQQQILLEPEVVEKLLAFISRTRQWVKKHQSGESRLEDRVCRPARRDA